MLCFVYFLKQNYIVWGGVSKGKNVILNKTTTQLQVCYFNMKYFPLVDFKTESQNFLDPEFLNLRSKNSNLT